MLWMLSEEWLQEFFGTETEMSKLDQVDQKKK